MSQFNTKPSDLQRGDDDRADDGPAGAFTCPRAARLDAYYDGELSPDAAAEVESHVDSCIECTAHLRELRRVTRLLDAGPRPPHLSQIALHRIHAAVEAEVGAEAAEAQRPGRMIPLFRRLTAAAAILIAGASAVMYMQPPRAGQGVPSGGGTNASWEPPGGKPERVAAPDEVPARSGLPATGPASVQMEP